MYILLYRIVYILVSVSGGLCPALSLGMYNGIVKFKCDYHSEGVQIVSVIITASDLREVG